ncbi:MAG TPA: Ohr family peroxiredoxin [Phycisphaerales bacterium]|nr:Ohr family peroxiredoxin [Phycisphaerales bacterium]
MNKIDKVLFKGKTHTTASRGDGSSRGGHGALDIQLSSGGTKAELFTAVPPHPTAERFFAGAWSACYSAALGHVASQMKVKLPPDLSVEIEVDLGQSGTAWLLEARLTVRAPGVEKDVVERLAHSAHEICPYSRATRGNIDVAVIVATA